MVRRSEPQAKIDDRAFPVRVKFAVPPGGTRQISATLDDRMQAWLKSELARGEDGCVRWAWHSAPGIDGPAAALYFRSVADAHRFVDAFPEFELADGTRAAWNTRPGPVR